MLQVLSGDSMGGDGTRDPTGEDPSEVDTPRPDQDPHGVDPEVAGALRWSLRKKMAPRGGGGIHSSEEYNDETEGTRDLRWGVRKRPVVT